MNIFDTVQEVRPEVAPMPLADRRRIRESLFGVGHDDPASSFRSRSANGAVVSTAPHGTRATVRPRPSPVGPILRAAVGVLSVAAIAALVWTLTSGDDSTDGDTALSPSASDAASATSAASSATTTAPSSAAATVRTPVTDAAPLAVPEGQVAVDSATIDPAAPGATAAIVSGPDGREMWMAELDGDPAPTDQLDVRPIGAVQVALESGGVDGAAPSYRLVTECGTVILNDAPGTPADRPEMVAFLESITIDDAQTIAAALPEGFTVVDSGAWRPSYSAQFQVPVDDGTQPALLVQIPGGSLGQLTFGGRQLEPLTFLGGPAFTDQDPTTTRVYWQDASTVFSLSSTALGVAGLERFAGTLVATTPAEWAQRFSTSAPADPAIESTCQPQPSFGPQLVP